MTGRSIGTTWLVAALVTTAAAAAVPACKENANEQGGPSGGTSGSSGGATAAAPSGGLSGGTTAPAPAAAPQALEEGKTTFLQLCAKCHGPDGSGKIMAAIMKVGDLTDPAFHAKTSDATLRELVVNGKEKMPGFGTMLTPDKLDQVLAYTRTLKRAQ